MKLNFPVNRAALSSVRLQPALPSVQNESKVKHYRGKAQSKKMKQEVYNILALFMGERKDNLRWPSQQKIVMDAFY